MSEDGRVQVSSGVPPWPIAAAGRVDVTEAESGACRNEETLLRQVAPALGDAHDQGSIDAGRIAVYVEQTAPFPAGVVRAAVEVSLPEAPAMPVDELREALADLLDELDEAHGRLLLEAIGCTFVEQVDTGHDLGVGGHCTSTEAASTRAALDSAASPAGPRPGRRPARAVVPTRGIRMQLARALVTVLAPPVGRSGVLSRGWPAPEPPPGRRADRSAPPSRPSARAPPTAWRRAANRRLTRVR